MSESKLVLEILSGPLDGTIISLEENTEWGRTGNGPLVFPWDVGLESPQARFMLKAQSWMLESVASSHGTYRVNTEEHVTIKTLRLVEGDVLKASDTWLRVQRISTEDYS